MKLVVILLLLVSSILAQDVYYVHPALVNCSYQPCFVLEHYAQHTEAYFSTRSTFIFLAGNHSLHTTIKVRRIANLTIAGEENCTEISVVCSNTAFVFEDITNMVVSGLTFYFHSIANQSSLEFGNVHSAVISNTNFKGSGDLDRNLARALHSLYSSLALVNCHFEGGTGDNGGAIYASAGTILSIVDSTFLGNKARINGGAIYMTDSYSSITLKDTSFVNNWCSTKGGGLYISETDIKIIGEATDSEWLEGKVIYFSNNHAHFGGAMYLDKSTALLNGSNILFKNNSAINGGGIYIFSDGGTILEKSVVVTYARHLYFVRNKARNSGGAIYMSGSKMIFQNAGSQYFIGNVADNAGGAIYNIKAGQITIMGSSSFAHNRVRVLPDQESFGSAIAIEFSDFILSGNVTFTMNKGMFGTIALIASSASLEGSQINFIDNFAYYGGGIDVINTPTSKPVHISGSFVHNKATECGGAITIRRAAAQVIFNSINVTGNSKTAICIVHGDNLVFSGHTIISHNIGGGIKAINGILSFNNYTLFENNTALSGAAIYSLYGAVSFSDVTVFKQNKAELEGGAMYASATSITFEGTVEATLNSANRGGVLHLSNLASLTMADYSVLNSSHNHASQYGGMLHYEDTAFPAQCNFTSTASVANLPKCFLKVNLTAHNNSKVSIVSHNDSASQDGSYWYGGLLDKCTMDFIDAETDVVSFIYILLSGNFSTLQIEPPHNTSQNAVTSKPYKLCLCKNESCLNNFAGVLNISTYSGQIFNISVTAIAQGNTTVPTLVAAKVSPTATLKRSQSLQFVSEHCTDLHYNIYSTEQHEELVLYPDGPCRDTGRAKTTINVTILPCPDGFMQKYERCTCERRLQGYANCSINETAVIKRKPEFEVWVRGWYLNGSYQGLIITQQCPYDYCNSAETLICLQNPDIQYNFNRSGLLCGACASDYSLCLGSSRCNICSNKYLTLLLAFALAGILLVFFISVLKLTVATGMINSVILGANILQVNKHIFLPAGTRNILTVFIAWLNLDLGIETCFYDGMDAYAKTWLQFAFPLYIWTIISLVIVTSRYSLTVSKLIGHSPVATLLLMSYTKILRVIIEVYSFTYLEYPQDKRKVWLKDANVPYLQSKHLLLTIVTSLVLVFVFLPYTFLLLLGYKLYYFSDRKCFRWLNRIKPLLDSYYAPYRKHTRFWTGFLLLVRCLLYIVLSLTTISNGLTAIVITFSIISIAFGLLASGRLYGKLLVNILEASVYLNLIILSVAILAGYSVEGSYDGYVLLYCLSSGLLLVSSLGIICYHLHVCYTYKLMIWLKEHIHSYKTRMKGSDNKNLSNDSDNTAPVVTTSTVMLLREPLLELSSDS